MAVNELIVTAEFVSNILNEPLEESGGGRVKSVNGMIGDVVLTAEDIGYDDTTIADALDNLADELENKAAIIVASASGAIASFPDGSGGAVKSLVAQIEPKQDLHGYDNPWPAGGGKNLLNPSTFVQRSGYSNLSVSTSNNVLTISGYDASGRFAAFNIPTVVGEKYTVKYTARNSVNGVNVVESDSEPTAWLNGGTAIGINSAVTYTATKTWAQVWVEITANNATVTDLMFEHSASATSYAPYSNVCPISGWTGAEGKRTGANVWDEETESGYISASGIYATNANSLRSKNFCPCVGGETYYFVKPSTYTTMPNICWYDSEQNFILRSGASEFPAIPAPSNAKYFKISMWAYGATYNHDISINYQSTATEYNAYTASTISVTFPDAAGTVYGGTLDVTNGVLTVSWAMQTLSSSAVNSAMGYSAGYARAYAPNALSQSSPTETGFLCNMIRPKQMYISKDTGIYIYTGKNVALSIPMSAIDDYSDVGDNSNYVDAVKKFLTDNSVVVCYPISATTTYQLTPQEVTTLLGANNIWFDTGDTAVEYPADTKLYIDKVINAAIAAL